MEDLKVNNKKTFVKKGVTVDIVDAVIDCYSRNIDNVPASLLRLVHSSDPYEAAHNIWEWVVANIRYKKDPEGEQWIKTPSRLIYDGCGDCKSMTILICAVLTNLGIKNKFRFVSYDKTRNYTHVYPVAIIEKSEVPVDAVAYIQRGADFGEEIKYTYKKDKMNKTEISELSGFANMAGASVKLNDNMSAAKFLCESYKMVGIATCSSSLYDRFNVLGKLVDKYEKDATLFKIAAYAWITQLQFLDRRGIMNANATDAYVDACVYYVNQSNKQDKAIPDAVFSNPVFAENWNLIESQFLPVLDRYKPDCYNVDLVRDLMGMGMAGLYLFLPENSLTKAQRKKRRNQSDFVNLMINTSALTPLAALNFIYAGFVSSYKTKPYLVYDAMFNKDLVCEYVSPAITGEEYFSLSGRDDDECYTIEYNPTLDEFQGVQKAEVVKDNTTIADNIGDWISKATGWFKDIYTAVTGGSSSNGGGIIPNYTDNSGSIMGWVVLGLVGVGGVFLLKKKGKRK